MPPHLHSDCGRHVLDPARSPKHAHGQRTAKAQEASNDASGDNLRPCCHAATASTTKCQSGPFTHFRQFMPVPSGNGRHWANLRLGRLSRSGYLIARLNVAPKAPIPKGWPQLILSRFHRSCGTLVVGNGVAVEQPQADELNWWSKWI